MEIGVQLAMNYWDNQKVVEGKEFVITTKIDGERILAVKENGSVRLFSRDGKRIEGLYDIEIDVKNIPFDFFILDGELTLLDKGNLPSKEQYKETMKIARRKGEKHGLKMLVFDYIPMLPSINIGRNYKYKSRRCFYNDFHYEFVEALPILYQGYDVSMIEKLLEEQTSKGEEGIMINIADAPYVFNRTCNLLKVKKFKDADLPIIGFEEGKGRNANKLGALIVDYKGNKVKVGTGFTDELREMFWKDKERWLGKTITVKYFEETPGGKSLRFPVYVDYREDK